MENTQIKQNTYQKYRETTLKYHAAHREYFRLKQKEYYAKDNKRMTCDCGTELYVKNYKKHTVSNIHQNYLKNKKK